MELTQQQQQESNSITALQAVFYETEDNQLEVLKAGPSHFSPELTDEKSVKQKAVLARPYRLCSGGEIRMSCVWMVIIS